MLQYQHRACKACGKRIPRWTDGKPTLAARLFCSPKCGQFYRRLHPVKRGRQNAKKEPISSALPGSVRLTEGRSEYGPCQGCGRMQRITASGSLFCNDGCREYVPLPARKPDGDWFIVAGTVDLCHGCGLAISPRNPQGFLTPYRRGDGHPYCSRECSAAAADERAGELAGGRIA